MKTTYSTLAELNENIDSKISSVKNLIDHLRSDEYKTFKPVRQFPLSRLFDKFNIPADGHYRKQLLDGLRECGFLETEGQLSGIKYRLKQNDMMRDSLTVAGEISEYIASQAPRRRQRVSHYDFQKHAAVLAKDLSSKPVVSKKEFSLGEKVFLLKDNKIVSAKITGLKYETLMQTSEDYPRVQQPVSVNYNNIICSVLLPDNTHYTSDTHHIYPDIDLLLKSLQIRYFKS